MGLPAVELIEQWLDATKAEAQDVKVYCFYEQVNPMFTLLKHPSLQRLSSDSVKINDTNALKRQDAARVLYHVGFDSPGCFLDLPMSKPGEAAAVKDASISVGIGHISSAKQLELLHNKLLSESSWLDALALDAPDLSVLAKAHELFPAFGAKTVLSYDQRNFGLHTISNRAALIMAKPTAEDLELASRFQDVARLAAKALPKQGFTSYILDASDPYVGFAKAMASKQRLSMKRKADSASPSSRFCISLAHLLLIAALQSPLAVPVQLGFPFLSWLSLPRCC